MTSTLRKYLDLKTIMAELEAVDEAAAESQREIMDGLWYSLSDSERSVLDDRTLAGPIRVLEAVRLPATSALLQRPPLTTQRLYDGNPVRGWRTVA